uniref:HTH CENPB-type domain-containing protein n=1 Tax=Caenorhabditis japonica TaxID=281687 RepID=A0A8R1DUD4_CAEJA
METKKLAATTATATAAGLLDERIQTEQCLSFEYDASILQCSLHSDDGQPFGASVLTKAAETISFFQQICLLEEAVCNAPYSFERYPQSILVGHSMKVLSVDGLSDCLSQCAMSSKLFNFLCKSAIYYYETGECIMNRDSKFIYPKLFKTNVLDTLVDYFENNCADVTCRAEETLHWIRTEEYLIDALKDVIVESSDAISCNQVCQQNKIGEENFPCKAFAYSNSKQECHLTAESSYVGHKGDRAFNLAPLNSGEYFEKYCLATNLQCIEASFELVANRMMASSYKTIPSLSQHECLSQCMKDGARCSSVTYFYMDDECQLSDISQFSRPNEFVVANFTDYFDKICDPADPKAISSLPTHPDLIQNKIDTSSETDTEPVSAIVPETVTQTEPDFLSSTETPPIAKGATNLQVVTTGNSLEIGDDNLINDNLAEEEILDDRREVKAEVEGTVIDDTDDFSREIEDSTELTSSEEREGRVKARLSTECRMSGISVSINFAAATSGTIYIKDHFSSCHQPFSNTTFAELHIPFPTEDDLKCGGVESEPHKWDYTVVVERNDMKTPSLITTKDKRFEVSCDFSKIADKNQLAALKMDLQKLLESLTNQSEILTSQSEPKRNSYTLEFKIKVVEYAKKENISRAAREFNVNRQCISRWMTQKEDFESNITEKRNGRKRVKGAGRQLSNPNFDKELLDWIQEQKSLNLKVSRKIIQDQARLMNSNIDFVGSNGWLESFLKRHNLSARREYKKGQKETSPKEEEEEEG